MRMQFHEMAKIVYLTAVFAIGAAAVLFPRSVAGSAADCTTVMALVSACSSFVRFGSPDPMPDSPCCVAMWSLRTLANSDYNRRPVCQCLMDLITAYSSNATAIATLPGFCGVSLGFTIDPNTDCEYVDQLT